MNPRGWAPATVLRAAYGGGEGSRLQAGNGGEEQVEEGQGLAGSERATQGVGNAFNHFLHYCLVIYLYIYFS